MGSGWASPGGDRLLNAHRGARSRTLDPRAGGGRAAFPQPSPSRGAAGRDRCRSLPLPPSAAAACGPAPSQPPPRPSAPGSASLRGLRAGGAQSREQASYPWALLSLGSGAFPPPPPCPWLDSRSRLRRSCFSWDSQHPAERLRCSKAIGQRSLEEGSGIWGEPGHQPICF